MTQTSSTDAQGVDDLAVLDRPRRTIHDIQRDAAMDRQREISSFRRRVEDLLIPNEGLSRRRIGTVYPLSEFGEKETYVAELIDGEQAHWVAVVDSRRPHEYQETLDAALVHVVALRHDGRTTHAHHFALRVLNAPTPG